MEHVPFKGAKVALLCGDRLVAILRDDDPGIPYPNLWDVPGGGREGSETPEETVLREVYEEIGLVLTAERLTFGHPFDSGSGRPEALYFFLAEVSDAEVDTIIFGDEGQRWEMMGIRAFVEHRQAVPTMQERLRVTLAWAGRSH